MQNERDLPGVEVLQIEVRLQEAETPQGMARGLSGNPGPSGWSGLSCSPGHNMLKHPNISQL